jgi:hypothetical protein
MPTPLRTSPGQHRFVWDLHYETSLRPTEDEREPKGVWAPPGRYQIVLGIGGVTLRQTLNLNPDPRVRADAGDYRHEFELARSIENARVQIRICLRDAEALHRQVTKAAATAAPEFKSRLVALDARLAAEAGLDADDHRKSAPSRPHAPDSLQGLSDGFDKLAEAVDGSDGAPTPDAESGYRQRAAMLASTLRMWTDLKQRIAAALGRGRP